MDIEKKIKNQLQDATSLEGVDASDLWKGIEEGLEESQSGTPPFYKASSMKFLGLIVIMGSLIWGLLFINQGAMDASLADIKEKKTVFGDEPATFLQDLDQLEHNNQSAIGQSNTIWEASDKPSTTSMLPVSKAKGHLPNVAVQPSLEFSNQKNTFDSYNNLIKKENNNTAVTPSTPFSLEFSNQKNISDSYNNLIKKENKPTDEDFSTNSAIPTLNDQVSTATTINHTKTIAPLVLQHIQLPLPSTASQEPIEPDLADLALLNDKSTQKRFSIGIFGGVHTMKNIFFTPSHRDQLTDDLNKGYDYELGLSLGLTAAYHFHKNLFVLTGLEYNQSRSEFNATQAWITTVPSTSSPTGYSTALATRTVKHHNSLQYYTIPLLIGLQKTTARLTWGISGGVYFNFTQLQKGRTLDYTNTIVDFDSAIDGTNLPTASFFMAYGLSPFVRYNFSNVITFQLKLDGRFEHYGFSDLYQLQHGAIYMGLNVGTHYRF